MDWLRKLFHRKSDPGLTQVRADGLGWAMADMTFYALMVTKVRDGTADESQAKAYMDLMIGKYGPDTVVLASTLLRGMVNHQAGTQTLSDCVVNTLQGLEA